MYNLKPTIKELKQIEDLLKDLVERAYLILPKEVKENASWYEYLKMGLYKNENVPVIADTIKELEEMQAKKKLNE